MKRAFTAFLFVAALAGHAEQAEDFDGWKVHYVAVSSTFLTPEIAEQYDIVRARDRAVCVISIRDPDDGPATAPISGHFTNLMSQKLSLKFKKIESANSIYYVAVFHFSSGEELDFEITLHLPQGERTLEFKQKIYNMP